MNKSMRTLLLTITIALLVVGCDNKTYDMGSCTFIDSYDAGLAKGLKMAPPCDITNYGTYKDKCVGEYNSTTWTSCYGERTLPNGDKYRGGYLEGKANGKGEFINADGTRYLGDYEKGKRNGYGKEYAANGSITKEGEWSNGIFAGDYKNKNFLIGLCTVNTEEWAKYKCNSNLVMHSDEMTVSFQTFEDESIVLDLVFGSRCDQLLGASKCINKTFRGSATYELISDGSIIQNTHAGGCVVPNKYTMEKDILYQDYAGEARGNCKDEQIAAAKRMKERGKRRIYYVNKN